MHVSWRTVEGVVAHENGADLLPAGRNGGHVVGQSWQLLTPLMASLEEGGTGLTAEQAMDVIMLEQSNLDLVESIVRSEGIDADFWRGSRVEVLTSPEGAADNMRNYELMMKLLKTHPKHKGRVLDWEIITDPAQVRKVSCAQSECEAEQALTSTGYSYQRCYPGQSVPRW